jgi:hypothetical protein
MDYSKKDVLDAISLLLAEKRTSLAVLRSGIIIFTLPLSVFTILITSSNFYDYIESFHLMAQLIIICSVLIFIGMYIIYRSFNRIIIIDSSIEKLKNK